MEVDDEKDTKHAKKMPIKIINKISDSVCKIIIPKDNGGKEYGTGFFMYLLKDKRIECLITNYHVITQSLVDSHKKIKIQIKNEKEFEIELNDKTRYIKCYEKPIDITIIEIIDSDYINEVTYLYYDMNYLLGYQQYKNEDIFTIQHPLGNDAEYAPGKIIKVHNCEFLHSIDTDHGSSGSPIILCGSLKVLGIHKGSCKNSDNNIGTFIGEIMNNSSLNTLFQSELFLEDKYFVLEKYKNDEKIKEIKNLFELKYNLENYFKIKNKDFDPKGNKYEGWSVDEKRGEKIYNPPIGWIGFGLKVLDKYYEGNDWLGNINREGEWCIAYYYNEDESYYRSIITNCIYGKFKINTIDEIDDYANDDDIFHPGNKVGNGVICFTDINKISDSIPLIDTDGLKYRVALMVRLNPNAIRCPKCCSLERWVVNNNDDEIRPYRILIKKGI